MRLSIRIWILWVDWDNGRFKVRGLKEGENRNRRRYKL